MSSARRTLMVVARRFRPAKSWWARSAGNDDTTLAFQQLLTDRWATSTGERTTHDVGQPGVRLRCYLDLNQPVVPVAPADALPQVLAEAQGMKTPVRRCGPRRVAASRRVPRTAPDRSRGACTRRGGQRGSARC
ncbi:DUF6207 family protein [Streptomyces sp. NPDC051014]|uniref:DUF6207 family protein n=1 Tax=Streptomyces sp. NPDC051014 TaxID=3155751 RepID=UPI0033DEAFA8